MAGTTTLHRVRGLGLRTRMTAAFAIGALLITALLTIATLGISRQVLLDQRESAATDVAIANAAIINRNISAETEASQMSDNLAFLVPSDSFPLVLFGDTWIGQNQVDFGEQDVPSDLLGLVSAGSPAHQRAEIRGQPFYVVGIPIPRESANLATTDYFEAFALDATRSTLRTLGIILLTTSAAATLFAAALGYWLSRQTLRPLRDVGDAARALEAGRLDTRIEPPGDADLAALVTAFNDMAGTLEARIERDGRFASEVSHELRSPLMTLTASIEVLENSRDDLSPRAQTALDLLASDVQRFKALVQDLLEISRFDVGTANLNPDDIHVKTFLEQIIAASASTAELHVPTTLRDLVIVADKRRLGRVMSNLLGNAATHGEGPVVVSLDLADTGVQISVEDEGPGVLPDERAVIFDRFSRGAAGGNRGDDTGVGLGLALVAEDVNLHGGRVWVDARRDGRSGARFVVELPVRATAAVLEPTP